MQTSLQDCELCCSAGGETLWQSPVCRVVRVADPDYPGFCRVIWQAHVREMTDLSAVDRQYLMEIVFAVESLLRRLYRPEKINLASFGNMTPHVHWHVIPRWLDDKHFPQPVWGAVQRENRLAHHEISTPEMARALFPLLDPIENQRRRGV